MDNRHSNSANFARALVKTFDELAIWKSLKMTTKKVCAGQMWKSEQTGEVFVVTSLYRDVLASFAMLRAIHASARENNKRAKVVGAVPLYSVISRSKLF